MKSLHKVTPAPTLKEYWSDNERFADLFNEVLFQGEDMINPKDLINEDTDSSLMYRKDEAVASISRTRDVIKWFKKDAVFVLIGLESQMKIHYAMPVRNMMYDALGYVKQCKAIESKHRKNKDTKSSDEFLSGMTKEDRIKPVFTLVVYYNEKPWDGAVCLSDMMDVPVELKSFINDQKIHLLNVHKIDGYQFKNQDNQDLFEMISVFYQSGKKMNIEEFKKKYKDREIHWETAAAIGAATNSKQLLNLMLENKGGTVNMCMALDSLYNDGISEGILKGKSEGKIEGKNLINRLNVLLLNDNRLEDLIKSSSDTNFQNELLEEYNLFSSLN